MTITWNHFRSSPDTQRHLELILTNLTTYGNFSAPIYLATVYEDHIDLVLEDGSTEKLVFFVARSSLTVWPELRYPREQPHEDRRIELSARVIVGGSR